MHRANGVNVFYTECKLITFDVSQLKDMLSENNGQTQYMYIHIHTDADQPWFALMHLHRSRAEVHHFVAKCIGQIFQPSRSICVFSLRTRCPFGE